MIACELGSALCFWLIHRCVRVPCLSLKTRRQICSREEIHNLEEELNKTETAVRFGRNDFQDITKQNGIEGISNYIVKYILKSDEKNTRLQAAVRSIIASN